MLAVGCVNMSFDGVDSIVPITHQLTLFSLKQALESTQRARTKACSTLAGLPREPTADEQEETEGRKR